MDDLSVNVPVTHERTKPDGVNARRFSTGKIFLSTTGDQGPNYLRASAGSCHDFCKHGKKNELEVKTRFPVKSIPRRLSTVSPQRQSSVESAVFPKRKSMSVIELKQSPDLKTLLPDAKQKLSMKPVDSQSSFESEVLAETKKTSLAKLKSPFCPKPHVSAAPKIMKREASSSPDKLEVSSEKGPTKLKEKNVPAKHITPLKSKSLAVKELSSPVTLQGSTSQRNTDLKISQRTGTSLKLKTSSLEQASSPSSLGGLKGQRTSDLKIGKSAGKFVAAVKKVLVPPAVSLSPKPALKRIASLKAQNRPVKVLSPRKNQNIIRKAKPKEVTDDMQNKIRKAKPKEVNNGVQNKIRKAKLKELNVINDDEVKEKTLYVIKVETENNKHLESDRNKNCEVEPSPPSSSSSPESLSFSSHEGVDQESGYTMSDTEEDSFSEADEDDYIESAGNDGRKARKSGMVGSKDKDGKPLKFRRGKVVNMQVEDNIARRLKFRRGTVLGDNPVKSDAHRRSFKKRGVRSIGTSPGAEKVVLRHQDVEGKKDEKGLFNNVIEETASKLVETRKSKVKALVGAFETVISLQERKLSANYAA